MLTFRMDLNHMEIHKQNAEPYSATLATLRSSTDGASGAF